jgi:hypothetical protein
MTMMTTFLTVWIHAAALAGPLEDGERMEAEHCSCNDREILITP